MDRLVLTAGYLGFPAASLDCMQAWVGNRPREDCVWSQGLTETADVWLVNGSAIADYEEGKLAVRQPLDCGALVHVDLQGMRHLLAVACKGPCGIACAIAFEPDHESSVLATFRTFEMRLAALRCEYALGATMIWHHDVIQEGGVYHLLHRGRLVGVLDSARQMIGFPVTMNPGELLAAEWHKRPRSAGVIPGSFITQSMWDPVWTYASRTRAELLPSRFRRKHIHLHRLPRVRAERLQPSHIKMIAALQSGPALLVDLARKLGIAESVAAHEVAALHSVGSVCTRQPEPASHRASGELSAPPVLTSIF